MALYEGKESGRARWVAYAPHLDRERQRLARLEGELRNAIFNGDIEPFFQPLACARTGEFKGVEALARWRRGDTPVGPDVFIPLAEKSGLIDMLGLQMLRKSVRAAKSWPGLSLSVNVSPIQLCNPGFAGDVLELLAAERFDPKRLTLEITENVLISNPEQAKRAIDALKLNGIRFSLDDFGCGYASIGALRQFGFDRMKIDRSLVLAADRESSGIDVLKATISLAAALGIPVTAEGIETGRQAEVLRDAGCDQLQGYLVGRPMAPGDISQAIAKAADAA
jgi:EAL domain-containing protein (putative c-di-GMP-specific phosphodiesterase class I)